MLPVIKVVLQTGEVNTIIVVPAKHDTNRKGVVDCLPVGETRERGGATHDRDSETSDLRLWVICYL
jgi:hypothetical protein